MSKKVIGIWAQTKNGVIGKDQGDALAFAS